MSKINEGVYKLIRFLIIAFILFFIIPNVYLTESQPDGSQNQEQVESPISQSGGDQNQSFDQEELQGIESVILQIQELNINWDKVSDQLQTTEEKVRLLLKSEEGQNLLQQSQEFTKALFDTMITLIRNNELENNGSTLPQDDEVVSAPPTNLESRKNTNQSIPAPIRNKNVVT